MSVQPDPVREETGGVLSVERVEVGAVEVGDMVWTHGCFREVTKTVPLDAVTDRLSLTFAAADTPGGILGATLRRTDDVLRLPVDATSVSQQETGEREALIERAARALEEAHLSGRLTKCFGNEGERLERERQRAWIVADILLPASAPSQQEGGGDERQGLVNALDLLLAEFARTGVIDDEGSQQTVVNAVGWFEQAAGRKHEFHDVLIDGATYEESEANRV